MLQLDCVKLFDVLTSLSESHAILLKAGCVMSLPETIYTGYYMAEVCL